MKKKILVIGKVSSLTRTKFKEYILERSKKLPLYRKGLIIIFDFSYLVREKISSGDIDRICKDNICLLYSSVEDDSNKFTAYAQKHSFFDYILREDSKSKIVFKLNRALDAVKIRLKMEKLRKTIKRQENTLTKLDYYDRGLNCYNWRFFVKNLPRFIEQAQENKTKFSIVFLDIDYFRQINEIYTYQTGDAVVKELAALIKKSLGKKDILIRWKEDTFILIINGKAKALTVKFIKRLKDKISHYKFHYGQFRVSIKISAGVVGFPEDKLVSSKDIITALENTLELSKSKGGNCVSSYIRNINANSVLSLVKKDMGITELKKRVFRLNNTVNQSLIDTVYGFAKAIEMKDAYTASHTEDTASIAVKIAKYLKLSSSQLHNIAHAAILHDLGKIGIDEKILSKKDPLTKEEREVIKTHPWIAAEILRGIHSLRGAIPAILYHHERYDGKGYPLGLKGEEIPLGARIIAVADVYQALISNRVYRKAYSKKKAIEIIKNERGKHFDPKIVDAFLKIVNKI